MGGEGVEVALGTDRGLGAAVKLENYVGACGEGAGGVIGDADDRAWKYPWPGLEESNYFAARARLRSGDKQGVRGDELRRVEQLAGIDPPCGAAFGDERAPRRESGAVR